MKLVRERERGGEREGEGERERELATLSTGWEAGKKCGGTIVGSGQTHNL